MFTLLALLLVVTLSVSLFACKDSTPDTPSDDQAETAYTINVLNPDGAPALALGYMRESTKTIGSATVNYETVNAEALQGALSKGTADFIIAPTFLGVNLAKAKGLYQLLATTSWGNLFIVTTDSEVQAYSRETGATAFLQQFAGKEISTIGNGKVDVAFEYLFEQCSVSFTKVPASDGTAVLTALKLNQCKYGMVGEPMATGITRQVSGARIVARVSDIWNELTGLDFPQASLFVKKSFIAEHPAAYAAFVEAAKQSVAYFNANAANATEIANSLSMNGALVGSCYQNIAQNYVDAQTAKASVVEFMRVLKVSLTEEDKNALFVA